MDWWKKSIIHDRRTFPQTIFIKIKASALSRSRSYWGSFHSSMKLCRAHNFCASPLKEVECNYFLKSFSLQSLFPQAGIVVFVGREMKKVSSAQQQQKLLASSLSFSSLPFCSSTIVFFFSFSARSMSESATIIAWEPKSRRLLHFVKLLPITLSVVCHDQCAVNKRPFANNLRWQPLLKDKQWRKTYEDNPRHMYFTFEKYGVNCEHIASKII